MIKRDVRATMFQVIRPFNLGKNPEYLVDIGEITNHDRNNHNMSAKIKNCAKKYPKQFSSQIKNDIILFKEKKKLVRHLSSAQESKWVNGK